MKDEPRPADDDLDERLADLLSTAPETAPPPDLCDGVLARTSGPACRAAHGLLGRDRAGGLSELETELVGAHLAHCGACAGIATALERLDEELPSLADLAPGDGFVERVLAATRPRPVRDRALGSSLADVLVSLLRRPRIAWETAFVGTAALWLSLGLSADPALATRATTARSLALFHGAGQVTLETGQNIWTSTETSGRSLWGGLRHRVGERVERTGRARARLASEADRLKEALARGDLASGLAVVKAATRDARGAFWGLVAANGTPEDLAETQQERKENP